MQTPAEIVVDLRKEFYARKTLSVEWRIQQLQRIKDINNQNLDAIVESLRVDLGKPKFETTIMEANMIVGEATETIKNLKSWTSMQSAKNTLANTPGSCGIVRDPLGVVLIIGAWNYPFQLTLLPLIGAIAGGNCVLLKPSEVSEASSSLLTTLINKYLDTSCIKVVEGGADVTTEILKQKFDHIFYTGNGFVGKIVYKAAAEHLTPVTLELGGKSPCFVDSTASLEVAAKRICWGKFANVGQTCVAPDYILVEKQLQPRLIELLKKTIKEFFTDDPKTCGSYGKIINLRHVNRLKNLLVKKDDSDFELAFGGDIDEENRYIAPTLLANVTESAEVMQDEIFGPLLPIIPVENADHAIHFINARPKPLALYVFSSESSVHNKFVNLTSSGGICINECVLHVGNSDLPFGGVGPSGMGNYHGKYSFETFTHSKAVLKHSTWLDVPIRYPPYTESSLYWANKLV